MEDGASPQPGPADVADALAHLRALRFTEDEGMAQYLAGKPSDGWHVMGLPDALQRRLLRGEAYPWALGLADAWGWGHLLDQLVARPAPAMLTVLEAAQRLPGIDGGGRRYGEHMKPSTVTYHIEHGQLYVVYVRIGPDVEPASYRHRWVRCLFTAQVELEAATRIAAMLQRSGRSDPELGPPADLDAAVRARNDAHREWLAVRDQLPPQPTALDQVAAERASPDPLPIPPRSQGRVERERAMTALMIGDRAGWFAYLHPTTDRAGFVVDVPGPDGVPQRRQLAIDLVLPYVLGHADRHQEHRRVAYREGLG